MHVLLKKRNKLLINIILIYFVFKTFWYFYGEMLYFQDMFGVRPNYIQYYNGKLAIQDNWAIFYSQNKSESRFYYNVFKKIPAKNITGVCIEMYFIFVKNKFVTFDDNKFFFKITTWDPSCNKDDISSQKKLLKNGFYMSH